MATWTEIDDALLEPGKPARSVDALALRDNPVAIAEGAPGAPRIQVAAFPTPAAGDVICGALAAVVSQGTGGILQARTYFTVYVTGVLRFKATLRNLSGSSTMQILKNGVSIGSRSANGVLSVDSAVTAGDRIWINIVSSGDTCVAEFGQVCADRLIFCGA